MSHLPPDHLTALLSNNTNNTSTYKPHELITLLLPPLLTTHKHSTRILQTLAHNVHYTLLTQNTTTKKQEIPKEDIETYFRYRIQKMGKNACIERWIYRKNLDALEKCWELGMQQREIAWTLAREMWKCGCTEDAVRWIDLCAETKAKGNEYEPTNKQIAKLQMVMHKLEEDKKPIVPPPPPPLKTPREPRKHVYKLGSDGPLK